MAHRDDINRTNSRSAAGPHHVGPPKISLFFPSPATISFFLSPLNFGGFCEGRDPKMCTFGVLGLSCETAPAPAPKPDSGPGEGGPGEGGPGEGLLLQVCSLTVECQVHQFVPNTSISIESILLTISATPPS